MRKILFFILLIFSIQSYSQTISSFVINPLGMTHTNSIQLTSCLGQLSNNHYQNLSEGFLQSTSSIITTATTNKTLESSDINCYPNPTTGIVKLNSDLIFNYELINVNGSLIKVGQTNNSMIDLMAVESGMYFLNILDSNQIIIKTIKIIKQ